MMVRRVLSWYFRRVYDGLQLIGRDRLESISKTHTLIYAPNHRSQTDYLVLSYLLFQHGFAIPPNRLRRQPRHSGCRSLAPQMRSILHASILQRGPGVRERSGILPSPLS